MTTQWNNLIIELLFLSLLGFLYYIYQKNIFLKKIKRFKESQDELIKLVNSIETLVDENKTLLRSLNISKHLQDLKDYYQDSSLKEFLPLNEIQSLHESMLEVENEFYVSLPDHQKEKWKHFMNQLDDYLR